MNENHIIMNGKKYIKTVMIVFEGELYFELREYNRHWEERKNMISILYFDILTYYQTSTQNDNPYSVLLGTADFVCLLL